MERVPEPAPARATAWLTVAALLLAVAMLGSATLFLVALTCAGLDGTVDEPCTGSGTPDDVLVGYLVAVVAMVLTAVVGVVRAQRRGRPSVRGPVLAVLGVAVASFVTVWLVDR